MTKKSYLDTLTLEELRKMKQAEKEEAKEINEGYDARAVQEVEE